MGHRSVVSISTLARELGVSEITIRRDLARLEREGWIRRTRGGAVAAGFHIPNLSYAERAAVESEAKLLIGRAAAKLVGRGEVVFLGSGSTSFAVARALAERGSVTIITNSTHVLTDPVICGRLQVISTGGLCDPRAGSLVGPVALDAIVHFRAHKAFIGCSGISEDGVFNESVDRAAIARQMIERSTEVYVVADHTKFGHSSLALITRLAALTGVVTDRSPAQDLVALLERLGVNLIVASQAAAGARSGE